MSTTLTQHLPHFKNSYEYFELYDISPSSYDSYFNGLKHFGKWIDDQSLPSDLPLPVNTIKDYMFYLVNNNLKPSTIQQRRVSISWLHRMNEFTNKTNPMSDPEFKGISQQIKKIRASRNQSNKPLQKEPLRIADIKKLCRRCNTDTLHGLRDRALLLIGFATGLRRAELVNLDVKDIMKNTDKKIADVHIIQSKTDQLAIGVTITIDAPGTKFCPITAVNAWIKAADLTKDKIFRRIRGKSSVQDYGIKPKSAVKIIKDYCEKASFDPSLYAGHSLRRGVLISAIENGRSLSDVKHHARHKEASTTEHYLGDAVFTKNITKGMFK